MTDEPIDDAAYNAKPETNLTADADEAEAVSTPGQKAFEAQVRSAGGHLSSVADEDAELDRKRRAEIARLANLAPGEYLIYLDDSARSLKMPAARLKEAVESIIKSREKEAREAKSEARRQEDHAAKARAKAAAEKKKQKEREFKTIDRLPEAEKEVRLQEVARRLDEDPATVAEEFAVASTSTASPSRETAVEPWPDKVETAVLLPELIKQIQRFIVMSDDAAITTALWTMFAWIHDAIAVHSPILAVTSADIDSGKSLLLHVLKYLTPRARLTAELTGPNAFRIVDREHPTLLLEEADKIFSRKPDLAGIINVSWLRGATITRNGHDFDPFCPKAIAGNRLSVPNVPSSTVSRLIKIRLRPKLPEEVVEEFSYTDTPEAAELRRKLARWSTDNAATIGEARPDTSVFNNRLAINWKLLFAISDDAGGEWPERARQAAFKIASASAEPSLFRRLIPAIYGIFQNRTEIPSAELVQLLGADPESEWHEYGRGRSPITQHQFAALVKDLEIRSVPLHPNKKMVNGYKHSQFTDAFSRYMPSNSHTRTKAK
jgi:hypothetical protein